MSRRKISRNWQPPGTKKSMGLMATAFGRAALRYPMALLLTRDGIKMASMAHTRFLRILENIPMVVVRLHDIPFIIQEEAANLKLIRKVQQTTRDG